MQFGLREDIIKKVNGIFANYNQIDEVIVYGSRAKGNYKFSSDIDLSIKGENINLDLLNKITLAIDDLLLPWKFDISIYKQISNPDLIDHINRIGQVIYTKEKD